jgi:hypothetical protein
MWLSGFLLVLISRVVDAECADCSSRRAADAQETKSDVVGRKHEVEAKAEAEKDKVRSQCLRLKNVFVRSLKMFGLAACLRF